jgi:hypothetical protein
MENFNFNRDFFEVCKAIEEDSDFRTASAMAWALLCYGYENREIEPVLDQIPKRNRLVLRASFLGIKGRVDAMVNGARGGKARGKSVNPSLPPSQGGRQVANGGTSRQKEKEKEKEKENIYMPAQRKHRHGTNANVLLTDEELSKLQSRFADWPKRIDDLSFYLSSTGKSYKSHYMTLLNWARKDGGQAQPQTFKAARKLSPEEELAEAERELAKWQS